MRNHALLHGRFQPPSIGHAATIAVTLQEWRELTIGVVYDSERPVDIDPRLVGYANIVDQASYGVARTPFRPEEVGEMWHAYIEHERLGDRVHCISCKRIEYDPDFSAEFPSDRFDLVWPALTAEDADTDRLRDTLFPEVLQRSICHVRPAMKLHGERIRQLITLGRTTWDKFIPPGAYETFLKLDGAQRMAEAIRARAAA